LVEFYKFNSQVYVVQEKYEDYYVCSFLNGYGIQNVEVPISAIEYLKLINKTEPYCPKEIGEIVEHPYLKPGVSPEDKPW
jgi:hypothetical protein